MNKPTQIVIGLVVLAVLAYGGYRVYHHFNKAAPQPQAATDSSTTMNTTPEMSASPASDSASMQEGTQVAITSSGFNPQAVTIKAGQTVTWTNQDSEKHTVNSAVHPTHLVYPPLNLGLIPTGTSKSLTFPTPGTYKYHDHLNPSLNGQVVVQ